MNNILIIGAGSIGGLMGAALIKAGLNITFAGKPNSSYTENLKNRGLQLYYPDGRSLWISPLHPNVRFVDTKTDLKQKFDLIIVALKSNHLSSIVSYIQACSSPETILIHAQNGIPYWWFNCDRYLKRLERKTRHQLKKCSYTEQYLYLESIDPGGVLNRNLSSYTLAGCVVKAPCSKNGMGKIKIRKSPRLIFGLTNNDYSQKQKAIIKDLCAIFTQNGVKAEYTANIRTAICNKLAINLTTNILSALTGKVIAELTSNSFTNSSIKNIIAEVNCVFKHYGIAIDDLPTEEKIYAYIKTPGSQTHLPSLAQDLSQHKPGEISLIAAPVEMALAAGIEIPTLHSLSELLKVAQSYSVNCREKSPILALDNLSGCYMLTKNVCESSIIERHKMPSLIDHLVRVNVSAVKYN